MVRPCRHADRRGKPDPVLHARSGRVGSDPGQADPAQPPRPSHSALLLRYLGRAILFGETPPAPMVAFLAQQIGIDPGALAEYGRRDTNRREHAVEAQRHHGLHPPVREDRRAALSAALAAATASDKGMPIAEAIIAAFRERKSVLPATDTLDRIGRAAGSSRAGGSRQRCSTASPPRNWPHSTGCSLSIPPSGRPVSPGCGPFPRRRARRTCSPCLIG